MSSLPDLLDFVVFFEAEPRWVSPGGWYLGATFETVRGNDRVIVTLAPDDLEFAVEWLQDGVRRLNMKTVNAQGWEIISSANGELLRVTYRDDHVKVCELHLRPIVRVELLATW